jgi:hypothetical protein
VCLLKLLGRGCLFCLCVSQGSCTGLAIFCEGFVGGVGVFGLTRVRFFGHHVSCMCAFV